MDQQNFESILKEAPSTETPQTAESGEITSDVQNNTETKSFTPAKKSFSIFDDTLNPVEVDVDKLKKYSRMFTASSPVNVPNERLEALDRIIEKAEQLGFTFRSMGDSKDKLNTEVTERATRIEYYLPWAGFNADVDAKLPKPTEKGANIACWIDATKKEAINNAKGKNVPREDIVSDYNLLSPAIKTFNARNVHIVLGDDCETSLNFILVYTECGAEKPKDIKWDKAQKSGYYIDVGEKFNIPVFNLSKPDCELRLTEYLETFK